MSLPTITGVPPEIWDQIIQILNQFGVTVWDLAQQGITTWEGAGGLKEYLLNHGWELKEVWDLKYMWFQTGAGDVTQSNALVQYVANRVTVAGTAGAEYVNHFTYGETTMGKLKKGIVFACIFSLLVETLQPNFITDVLKSQLNAVIDFFADENDDVPVILDGNGKIYYHEDMINALRQALINAGVYDSGEFEPTDPLTSNVPFKEKSGYNGSVDSYTANASAFNRVRTYYRYLTKDQIKLYNNGVPYSHFTMKNVNTGDVYEADGYVLYALINNGNTYLTCTPIFYSTQNLPSGDIRCDLYCDSTKVGYSYESFNKVWLDSSPDNYVYYCSQTAFFGSDSVTAGISANNLPIWAGSWPISGRQYDAFYYLVGHQGSGGIEGITVNSTLVDRGIANAQTSLEDIFPSYATDKVTTINPSDEDITASDNWYPISTSDSDVWTDGITEQQSETATDGEVTPDIQAQIADAIKQILEDYYRDPTDPNIINYPEIPVGDSGDTPPENPDLLSGSSNGLWAIYNPSKSEVQQFGAWLWSDNILDQITRMFNSPIDAVIGFHMIYCTPITGASKTIKAGYLDSPVSAPEVTDQYKDIDCGTIAIPEYYRNALDYDNTRISLFLPFIGIVPLDTAQVMGSSLSILYRIDVLTGTCLAQVSVIKENSNAVMYTYQGNCSVQIPLTATTYTGMVGALLSGISAGASIMTGNIIGAVSAGIEGAMRAGTGLTGVRQSGTLGANAGALGIRIPYVIITHPVSVMPDDFNSLEGLPSAELVPLSSVSGFTRVTYVHLENIPATSQEIEEITGLLQSGVIF